MECNDHSTNPFCYFTHPPLSKHIDSLTFPLQFPCKNCNTKLLLMHEHNTFYGLSTLYDDKTLFLFKINIHICVCNDRQAAHSHLIYNHNLVSSVSPTAAAKLPNVGFLFEGVFRHMNKR